MNSSTPISLKNKIGLVLAGLLGLADVLSILAPASDDGNGPPFIVLALDCVLGVLTLAAVVYTWRTGNRVGARVLAGTRILSALTSLPAFFVSGVPAGVVVLAAVGVVLTVVAVGLVLTRPAPTASLA
jgi:hypothetical protein